MIVGAKGLSPSIEWDCRHSMQKGGFFKVFMCNKGSWTVGVRFPTLWVIMILISCFIHCVHSAERVKTNSFKLGHPIQQTMHPSTCIKPPKKVARSSQRIMKFSNWLLNINIFSPWLAKSFHCYYRGRFKKKKKKKLSLNMTNSPLKFVEMFLCALLWKLVTSTLKGNISGYPTTTVVPDLY